MQVFDLYLPPEIKYPIVLSIPHLGIDFPDELRQQFKPDLLPPDDTDWALDLLYEFAEKMQIPIIKAKISRWVIDLNRSPDSVPLYQDGRVITALCTTTNFLGENIYIDERNLVEIKEVERRKELYFKPYHQEIQNLIEQVKSQFGQVLLWDCHSIRRHVSSIRKDAFPDFILGDADQTSASRKLINLALEKLNSSTFLVQHNEPFKGGYITRYFGNPSENIHALQLEMSKDLYCDQNEEKFDSEKAEKISEYLENTLIALGKELLL